MRRRRAASEPRRAAIREALAAVKLRKEHDPNAIRAALVDEMAARGVTDTSPDELDVLTEIATSTSRAATNVMVRQVKAWGALARDFRELASYAQPRWALPPGDVPNVPTGEREAVTVAYNLTPEQLIDARTTVARVIAGIRDQSEDGDDEETRLVEVWLSIETDTSIGVHIGKYRIGELAGAQTQAVRAAIERWGGGTGTIGASADLRGSTPDTAHLDLWAPTSPKRG